MKRIFLHAADLEVRIPGRGKLSFHAPLPPDLAGAMERLPAFQSGSTVQDSGQP